MSTQNSKGFEFMLWFIVTLMVAAALFGVGVMVPGITNANIYLLPLVSLMAPGLILSAVYWRRMSLPVVIVCTAVFSAGIFTGLDADLSVRAYICLAFVFSGIIGWIIRRFYDDSVKEDALVDRIVQRCDTGLDHGQHDKGDLGNLHPD